MLSSTLSLAQDGINGGGLVMLIFFALVILAIAVMWKMYANARTPNGACSCRSIKPLSAVQNCRATRMVDSSFFPDPARESDRAHHCEPGFRQKLRPQRRFRIESDLFRIHYSTRCAGSDAVSTSRNWPAGRDEGISTQVAGRRCKMSSADSRTAPALSRTLSKARSTWLLANSVQEATSLKQKGPCSKGRRVEKPGYWRERRGLECALKGGKYDDRSCWLFPLIPDLTFHHTSDPSRWGLNERPGIVPD